jgi:nitrogen fixation protein
MMESPSHCLAGFSVVLRFGWEAEAPTLPVYTAEKSDK